MFQQSRQMHTIEPMDFLSHQKMTERMLSPQTHAVDVAQAAKRQRMEASGQGSTYDHLPVNFFPLDSSTVVVSKTEYEVIRQEVVNLKQTLSEFRNNVETEIDQLKKREQDVERSDCEMYVRLSCQIDTSESFK